MLSTLKLPADVSIIAFFCQLSVDVIAISGCQERTFETFTTCCKRLSRLGMLSLPSPMAPY